MLKIRAAQMDALQRYVDDVFIREMVTDLRAGFPEETRLRSDTELETYARAAINEARGYGLSAERDLCRFLNLSMRGGLEWHKSAAMGWAHELLRDESLGSPSDRLHKVHCQSAFRL